MSIKITVMTIVYVLLIFMSSSCSRIKDVRLTSDPDRIVEQYRFDASDFGNLEKSNCVISFDCKIRWSWISPEGFFSWRDSSILLFLSDDEGEIKSPPFKGGLGHWFGWDENSTVANGSVWIDKAKKIITIDFIENKIDDEGNKTGKSGPSPLNGRYRYQGEIANSKEVVRLMNKKFETEYKKKINSQ